MATLVARCCRKINQLKSMHGFQMQRYPRKIFKPKKQKKMLPWQHLLPGVAEKLISSNLCSGMERYPRKIFKPKKQKKVLPWQHLLPGVAEKLISSNLCSGMESKEPIKIFTSPRNIKKCCHGNTCCPVCQKTNPLQSVHGERKAKNP